MWYMRTMLVTDVSIQYHNYTCIYQLILILTNTLTNNEVIKLLQISSHRLYDHHKHLILYITEQTYVCNCATNQREMFVELIHCVIFSMSHPTQAVSIEL